MKSVISIIVPCYNEEESLPIFYKEINKISKKIKADFEFLFINDGSKDKTLDILKDISNTDSRVHYISFSRNFGKEAAMYAGLKGCHGDYVAIMDADMQDPPSMIIEMYNVMINEDYDCVALYSPKHEGYSIIRKTFTNCFYKLMDKISSVKQVPGARDFRLMKRKMVDAILSLGEYNRYSKGIFNFVGFKTKWIEYTAPDRVAGTTKWNFWKLFRYALEGIVAFSITPLVVSCFIGIICCLLSIIGCIISLIYASSWWPLAICSIGFMGGLVLFFMGILGMYMSKVYLEVKNRPIYIIDEEK